MYKNNGIWYSEEQDEGDGKIPALSFQKIEGQTSLDLHFEGVLIEY